MRTRSFLVSAALSLAGCTHGVYADVGADARLRVSGGTFVRGAPPADGSGPRVGSVDIPSPTVVASTVGHKVQGVLGPGSRTAALFLEGDVGYWVVRAGPPTLEAPDAPTYGASFDIAKATPPATYALRVWAADDQGAYGPSSSAPLNVVPAAAPTGALVVTLRWDRNADLDLHLVDGSGAELFYRDKASKTTAAQPDAGTSPFGALDVDSNPQCVIDGRREENVIYPSLAPAGHYIVRVDTFALCKEEAARWTVEVRAGNTLIASGAGIAQAFSTTYGHDRGAGVVATEFDLP
jgi:hypothetical protein